MELDFDVVHLVLNLLIVLFKGRQMPPQIMDAVLALFDWVEAVDPDHVLLAKSPHFPGLDSSGLQE